MGGVIREGDLFHFFTQKEGGLIKERGLMRERGLIWGGVNRDYGNTIQDYYSLRNLPFTIILVSYLKSP